MAYTTFPELGGATAFRGRGPVADAVPATDDGLTALEWSVVSLARRDRLGTLRRPGRYTLLLRALLRQPNPMLADRRLEALRRMAVLSWHYGYTVATRELKAFLDAGFTLGQYETLVDRVNAARAPSARAALA